jgi:hypothetical protein
MSLDWIHKWEPFTNEELATMGRLDLATDHEEVEDTISQFEACVQEIIFQPYKETVSD